MIALPCIYSIVWFLLFFSNYIFHHTILLILNKYQVFNLTYLGDTRLWRMLSPVNDSLFCFAQEAVLVLVHIKPINDWVNISCASSLVKVDYLQFILLLGCTPNHVCLPILPFSGILWSSFSKKIFPALWDCFEIHSTMKGRKCYFWVLYSWYTFTPGSQSCKFSQAWRENTFQYLFKKYTHTQFVQFRLLSLVRGVVKQLSPTLPKVKLY